MTCDRQRVSPLGAWAWGACLIVGWVLAFLVAFGTAGTAQSRDFWPSTAEASLRLDLALLLTLMGLLGLGASSAATRVVFGRWPSVRLPQLVVPCAGIALAIGVELTLHEWARVHIGQYEFDHMGITAITSRILVGCAVAAFAVALSPPGAGFPPLLSVVGAAAIIALVLVSNAPGLRDGIEPESWPLAILIGLSAAYVVGAVVIAVRRMVAG